MLDKLSHFFLRRRNWTLPYALFLLIFAIVPLLLIVLYAFTDADGAFTFANFRKFMMHPEAMNTFIYSIGIALITTLTCLLLGYPAAYILSQKQFNTSQTMVVLFILPMWVNILIRTLATVALFDFLNLPLGEGALVFGMVYNFLPFMIYPIYNTLQKMDRSLIEAAQDLGPTLAGVRQSNPAPLHAGHHERHRNGVHAYGKHLCHSRTADDEQHQTLRNNRAGEHIQRNVELRCSPVAHHAVADRRHHPLYERRGRRIQ